MTRFRDALKARVASRITLLFVLSAVVPVVVTGGLSFRAVNGQLEEHSRERLSQLAKNAGMSVVQNLLITETWVRGVRTELRLGEGTRATPRALPPGVTGLATTREGTLTVLGGVAASPSPLSDFERERFGRDRIVLRPRSSEGPGIRMALPIDSLHPLEGTLWVDLIGDSIWSSAETFLTLPTVADFCVLAGPDRTYCTSGTNRVSSAYAALGSSVTPTFTLDDDEGSLIVGQWSFYPDQNFAAQPWTTVVAETTDAVYAPLRVFAAIFPMALVLVLLLVILLSNVQIRRTLEPLQALETGTNRIAAGDLRTRVEVTTDDEFGALAGSFNAMAGQLGAQFAQFEAVQSIGQAALNGFDRDEVVMTALNELPLVSGCRSAAVLLWRAQHGAGEIVWLTDARSLGGTSVALGERDHAWLSAHHHHGAVSEEGPPFVTAARKGLGVGRLIVFPHVVKGEPHGATVIEMPEAAEEVPEAVTRRVRQIANQLAMALDEVRLVKELEDMSWGALVALARAIDAKSKWTAGHSERVTGMALALAREMGYGKADLDLLHRGGLLHDVGKIGVPNVILNKADRLTHDEMALVREHPALGARILAPIPAFSSVLPLVRHHHECWDGSGYPDGLAGEQIHPLTRVLTVADAFDAMASARPYRPGRPEALVVDALIADSGTQFDPAVIDALNRLMADRGTLYPGELRLVSA